MDSATLSKRLQNYNFIVRDQSFSFKCVSLRPFTRYYVIFDQYDYTAFCMQEGKRIGNPLISDASGCLNFTFFWNRGNESTLENNFELSKLFRSDIGNKLITISDKSGTSFIKVTLPFINKAPDIAFSKYLNASNLVLN